MECVLVNRAVRFSVVLGLALSSAIHTAAAREFVVNSTGDEPDAFPGDGVAEILPGTAITTLRAAIEEANAFPGADIIKRGRRKQAGRPYAPGITPRWTTCR